jgi:hypothetical protein
MVKLVKDKADFDKLVADNVRAPRAAAPVHARARIRGERTPRHARVVPPVAAAALVHSCRRTSSSWLISSPSVRGEMQARGQARVGARGRGPPPPCRACQPRRVSAPRFLGSRAGCPPCKMIAPELDKMSAVYTSVLFLKVDVDECEDVAEQFEVSAMPTFVGIKAGKEVGRVVGASKPKIEEFVVKHK